MVDTKTDALVLLSPIDDNSRLAMAKSNNNHSVEVVDLGKIARFRVPVGWAENPSEQAPQPLSYSRDFSPPGDPSVVLSVFFRGFMISEGSAQRFHYLLRQLPHELLPEEINSINQVLTKIADEDAFEIRSILTADMGGRRALIIDGEWKTSQTQFHGLMIEADESGREIQEVFFEAPITSFMTYLNEVVDSIRAIEWKGQ